MDLSYITINHLDQLMHKLDRLDDEKQLVNIFSSLGNDVRLLILSEVIEKNVKTSVILEKTDITIQALHKQITHLVDGGLIQKNNGTLSLTEFGKSITGQIPTLAFLSEHRKYFQHHTISNLPTMYLQSIGSLRNCQEIHSTVNVFEKIHSIIRNSKNSLKLIIAQFSLEAGQHLADRLDRGAIKVHYVMGENTIIPKGRKAFLEKVGWNKWLKDGIVTRKMIKNANLMMITSEDESLLAFPDNNNTVNLNSAFYSKDKTFHEWCNNLFEHIWNESHQFDEKKLHEI